VKPAKFKDIVTAVHTVTNGKKKDVEGFLKIFSMFLTKDPRVIETMIAQGRKEWAKQQTKENT
jgi:hypothetical protein